MPITIDDKLLVRDIDSNVAKQKGAPQVHMRYRVDYRNLTADQLMDLADDSVVIKRANPTRKLSQTELVELATTRVTFLAENAGHAIVSVEKLIAEAETAFTNLPKDAQEKYIADLMKKVKK